MHITCEFRTLFLISVCVLFLFPAWTIAADSTPDSLLTEKQILKIYYSAPDSALHLLNEAEARHLPEGTIHAACPAIRLRTKSSIA